MRNPFRRRRETVLELPPDERLHPPEQQETHRRLAIEQNRARAKVLQAEAALVRARSLGHESQ